MFLLAHRKKLFYSSKYVCEYVANSIQFEKTVREKRVMDILIMFSRLYKSLDDLERHARLKLQRRRVKDMVETNRKRSKSREEEDQKENI